MFDGRWLAAIEFLFLNLFWGIGYLFGFTVVTMLSVGTVFAEEFSSMIRGRKNRNRFWVFVRDGQIYLIAEFVSAVGWFFLLVLVWTIALCLGGSF